MTFITEYENTIAAPAKIKEKPHKRIATIDFETDPFKFGRDPKPFSWGFYNGEKYVDYWGDDCIKVLMNFLADTYEPMLIYAHNGGKFDFLFFVEYFGGSIRIVNGRILEATIGIHTFRDSYGILPIPLKKLGGKLDIDYKLLEPDVREMHKPEILFYQKADCVSLYDAVIAFFAEFGDVLTIGSAAMRELKKFHKFETSSAAFDKSFRNYYFGGRCQCFETGIIDRPIKLYDMNSAYPDAMKRLKHPVSRKHSITTDVTPDSLFVCWIGKNHNAVPVREKFGLNFATEYGTYWTTIHEFNVGLETGTIEPHKIKHAIEFEQTMIFDDFVDHFYKLRKVAQADNNLFLEVFYKLILNSSYGKFAQNPEHYADSIILPWGDIPPDPGFIMEYRHNKYAIWSKPTERHSYYNVATAASITGGTRSMLLRGLTGAVDPIYCDTDSIFCTSMTGNMHDTELGAWKLETQGTQMAIGGKKLYALMDGDKCIKKASKGVNLPPLAIFQIARGDIIETRKDAPTMGLDGGYKYIERNIKSTNRTA